MSIPANQKIYHITHINNLASILKEGYLLPDSAMTHRQGVTTIGREDIKERRRKKLLPCNPGTYVGEYVPFNFCPRSVMLYLIHRKDYPSLPYRGGQEQIIHLVADMKEAVRWAEENKKQWAFSLENAALEYVEFRNKLNQLDEINWEAVRAEIWKGEFKYPKQAEFLVRESFPWHLIEQIGTHSQEIKLQVCNTMSGNNHCPVVEILEEWYYPG